MEDSIIIYKINIFLRIVEKLILNKWIPSKLNWYTYALFTIKYWTTRINKQNKLPPSQAFDQWSNSVWGSSGAIGAHEDWGKASYP